MAWTTPMTFVASSVLTAAQLNTYIRDNLLETAVAKATTPGSLFIATGTNAIAERVTGNATVATSQTRASTSVFGDLATVGPAVTVTTGTQALVFFAAEMVGGSTDCRMSYAVSGASTIAADSNRELKHAQSSTPTRRGCWDYASGLTAGSNTFTTKYAADTGTGTFSNRFLMVIPL